MMGTCHLYQITGPHKSGQGMKCIVYVGLPRVMNVRALYQERLFYTHFYISCRLNSVILK